MINDLDQNIRMGAVDGLGLIPAREAIAEALGLPQDNEKEVSEKNRTDSY